MDVQTVDALYPLVYQELHQMAGRLRPGDSVTPTILVHEAYLRLIRLPGAEPWPPQRVRAVAAAAMRSVLVDMARRRRAEKRGGDQERVTLSGIGAQSTDIDVLALHEALERLAGEDPVTYRLVELRFFGGLTQEEVAEELGLSLRAVERRWRAGRAVLRHLLEGAAP